MRKALFTAAALLFAGTLFAESPFVGTWKLDSMKTKYTKGEPAKEVTLTIVEEGDNLQVSVAGTNSDGSPIATKYSVPLKGGEGTADGGSYDTVSSKLMGDVRENTFRKSGKLVNVRRVTISKDGKTMRSAVKGNNLIGKPVVGTDVFEKQ